MRNTCSEVGKLAKDKLKRKIQEGVTLRKKEVEQAKLAISKDEAGLSKLKNEEKVLKGLVKQLKGIVFVHVVSSIAFLERKLTG